MTDRDDPGERTVAGRDDRSTGRAAAVRGACVVVGGAMVLTLTVPVWVGVAAVIDVVTGKRRLPTVRLLAFLTAYTWLSTVGVIAALWFTVTGRRRDRVVHARVQGWWVANLLRAARPTLGARVEWHTPALPPGRLIVLARHASLFDSALPALHLNATLGRPIHYVLKTELQVDPCLNIYGRRLGNHFVDRAGDADAEVAAIAAMGREAESDAAVIIFPEGRIATRNSRARVRASLLERGAHDAVALADELQSLLPPKPAGTVALLEAMPDADVVLLAHTGLEGVARLRGLRNRIPLRRPVPVELTVVPRQDVPDAVEEIPAWLNDRWREIDAWVGSRQRHAGGASSR